MAKQKSRFPSYGLVRGPSHEQGGVAGMVAGEQPVELEGGEWIIPKEAVPDYLPVLKQITNEGRAMQQMQNGNSAMDALIASATMETGLAQPKSPMFQDGGQVQRKVFRNLRRVDSDIQPRDGGYGTQSIYSIAADQVGGGEGLRYYLSDPEFSKDYNDAALQAAMSARAKIMFTPEDSLPAALVEGYFDKQNKKSPLDFLKKLIGKEQGGMIKQYQQGGQTDKGAYPSKDLEMLQEYPTSYKFFMDRRGKKAYYPEQDTLAARMFRGEINPNQAFSKALMLPFEDESRYGGGKQQMQPRKQQEIRNPQMYGPPDSLMGPDTTSGGLNELLEYYKESERRNQLNALTGDTLDPQLDSLRLLQRMKKSKMPAYGRKSMQQGGQVLGKGQPLERRPSPSEQLAAMQAMEARPQDSLMSSMGEDKRVRPADKYIIKDGTMSKREMEVPKLSSAYLQSFGMETPLSKRQNDLLRHRALSPETLGINPQVQSLLGKALVQRLSNEPI